MPFYVKICTIDDCPGEWRKAKHSGISFCRVASDGHQICSSANFSTNGISYQGVCGRARGYQKGDTCGFRYRLDKTIDKSYVSGLSITYSSNPCQHIWSFASGRGEKLSSYDFSCPCTITSAYSPHMHLLAVIITVKQLLGIVVIMRHTFLMTRYWMEQDA